MDNTWMNLDRSTEPQMPASVVKGLGGFADRFPSKKQHLPERV
jgi:hypothetical protein